MIIFKRHTEEEYVFHSKEAAENCGNYDYKWEKTNKILGIFRIKWSYNRKAINNSNKNNKNIGF